MHRPFLIKKCSTWNISTWNIYNLLWYDIIKIIISHFFKIFIHRSLIAVCMVDILKNIFCMPRPYKMCSGKHTGFRNFNPSDIFSVSASSVPCTSCTSGINWKSISTGQISGHPSPAILIVFQVTLARQPVQKEVLFLALTETVRAVQNTAEIQCKTNFDTGFIIFSSPPF